MNYYSTLGISKGASREEVQRAYESQVNKIKEEIKDEKRASKFIRLFDEAYEALMKELTPQNVELEDKTIIIDVNKIREEVEEDKTLIINQYELQKEIENQMTNRQNEIEKEEIYNPYRGKVVREYDEEDDKGLEESCVERKRSSSRRKSEDTGGRRKKKQRRKNPSKDNDNEKGRRNKNRKSSVDKVKGTSKGVVNILMLPIKIILLPIIWVVSIIILLCKAISMVSWIASKVIIVGSIAVGAIHMYQIHIGQPEDIKLLILAALGVVISFFLPYILRVVPRLLTKLNNMLKSIVF